MKAARRKLEVPMPAAMPCKILIKSRGENHHSIGKHKTKYACVVDADESTRPRLEGAGHKTHQDHITAKGTKSVTHYSVVHVHSDKFQMQRGSGERGKLEKNPAWQLRKSETEKVIEEARNKGIKVDVASLMDICHPKNSELGPQYQKYKRKVVLRGDTVKDDSEASAVFTEQCSSASQMAAAKGSYAVFTEQGSSASQMKAAKVMDIKSRLPGCSGQAANAVSAHT